MGQQVILNTVLHDSDDLADGGHRDPVRGFFAILINMVAELDAAETILTLSAASQPDGSVPVVQGGVWVVGSGFNPVAARRFL